MPANSQSFGYDGFGNLVSKPPLSINVDPTNNRVTALSYDGNGNVTYQPGMTSTYNCDVENRMTGAPGVQYGYDGQNKRNYKAAVSSSQGLTSDEFYFYGADGKKIGTYYLQVIAVGGPANVTLSFTSVSPWTSIGSTPLVYFRGRALAPQDRLGSFGKYYPYGEEKGTGNPANDNLKFATYTRDAGTALDYADQRYYSSQYGRFMSADRYVGSASGSNDAKDPQASNRYSYTAGDPINRVDPSGEFLIGLGDWDGAGPGPCSRQTLLDGFSFFPNPFCYAGVGLLAIQRATEDDSSECYIELDAQRAGVASVLGISNPFKHNSIYVTNRAGQSFTLEASPSAGDVLYGGFLNRFLPRTGLYSTPETDWWDSSDLPLAQSIICGFVNRLLSAFNRWQDNVLTYDAANGPNSNSFAHWLVQQSGLDRFVAKDPPKISPGWNLTPNPVAQP